MAQSGSAGSQLNAADVLVMARERQRIDVEAVHESLVGKLVQLREKHKDIKHKHAIVYRVLQDGRPSKSEVAASEGLVSRVQPRVRVDGPDSARQALA